MKGEKIMIDIEKFICSLLGNFSAPSKCVSLWNIYIYQALKDQGLKYKDGKIVEIEPTQESKFKTGTYVVYLNDTYMLEDDGEHYILTAIKKNTSTPVVHIPYGDEDYTMRKWTIQDAKDGDVLANKYGSVFIYAGFEDDRRITVDSYCYITAKHNEFCVEKHETGSWYYINELNPATKEQRELLFAKMKEAGYEWDAEKKELKKIEQKPAEWSEEDKNFMYDTLSNLTELKDRYGDGYGNVGKCIDWLKSLKDRVLPQPKQEWSEEDKQKINRIYSILGQAADTHAFSTSCRLIGDKECVDLQDFLKSLRPQNWTKEDKGRYISCLQRLSTGNQEQPETINSKWFKEHVYPQNTWKPSEGHIKALEDAIHFLDCTKKVREDLKSLYEQLKKLMEE